MNTYELGSLIKNTTRQMYEEYSKEVGGLNHRGEPMPTWDELPEKIQAAWGRAAYIGVAKGTIAGMRLAGVAISKNTEHLETMFGLVEESAE